MSKLPDSFTWVQPQLLKDHLISKPLKLIFNLPSSIIQSLLTRLTVIIFIDLIKLILKLNLDPIRIR